MENKKKQMAFDEMAIPYPQPNGYFTWGETKHPVVK